MEDKQRENMEFDSQLYLIWEASIGFYEVFIGLLCFQEQSGEERIQLQLSCNDNDQIWVSWVWELRLCDQCCYSRVNVMSGNGGQGEANPKVRVKILSQQI